MLGSAPQPAPGTPCDLLASENIVIG